MATLSRINSAGGSAALSAQDKADILAGIGALASTPEAVTAQIEAADAAQRARIQAAVSGAGNAGYIDFTAAADGTPPAVLDSLQAVDFIFGATSRRPIISAGRLVVENQAGAGSGSLADYYQSELGSPITRIGAEWTQPAGANDGNGSMCYAPWAAVYEGGGSNVPASWAHVVVTPGTGATGSCAWWVCDGVGHLRQIKAQAFVNPAANGAARWRCESILDAVNGIGYTYLPDGSVMTLTDAEISANFTAAGFSVPTFASLSAASSVLMLEHYANTGASAATYPQFTAAWADTIANAPTLRQSKTPTAIAQARADATLRASISPAATVQVYSPTTALSVATTTSASNVDATNAKVVQFAGPTGRIIYQVSAWYEWSATDVMFWRLAVGAATATRASDTGTAGQKRLVTQVIEASGLTPGQSYTATLQHWSVSAGSATCKAGGSGGSMLPPLTMLALAA